ncbi:MAG TPA: heavy metal-associated domain-containing protein [Ornithinicoccus sp.]|jgi:copper chaperone|nr:heavy metal-associated domain-containing protein [Ornithinicoccus sp.]
MTTTALTTTTFRTEPFTCPSCVTKITRVVGRMDGVHDVSVLFNAGKVKVTHDPAVVGADQLAATITALGYPVTGHRA